MVKMHEYVQASSLEEAYELLIKKPNNSLIGGMGFLKLGNKNIGTAIDLCKLSLDKIETMEHTIEIGACVSMREIETSEIIKNYVNGMLAKAVSQIVGVNLRNTTQIGAHLASKHGFSDIIPVLLVLEAKLRCYKNGELPISEFLHLKDKDIVTHLILNQKKGIGIFDSIRRSTADFAVLNAAMYENEDKKILFALGARPGIGKIASRASEILSKQRDPLLAADSILDDLTFGSNLRGGQTYREEMAKALCIRMFEKIERGLSQ